jgi:hypothetical protein
MRSDELWQVRIPPADSTDELMAAVREAVARGGTPKFTKRTRIKLFLALVTHPFGIHHWVHYRTFDPGSGRIIVHNTWVCATCPKLRQR